MWFPQNDDKSKYRMIRQIKIIWTSCSLEVILLSGQEPGAKTQFVTSIVAQQLIIRMKHAAPDYD